MAPAHGWSDRFREREIGSLEAGKRADFIVLDRDILTCPADAIRAIRPVATYLGGKRVHPLASED